MNAHLHALSLVGVLYPQVIDRTFQPSINQSEFVVGTSNNGQTFALTSVALKHEEQQQ